MINRILSGRDEIVSEFLDRLGLKNVTSFSLSIAGPQSKAVLTATIEVSTEDAEFWFDGITKQYHLVEIQEEDSPDVSG